MDHTASRVANDRRVGLLAGWGEFPIRVAQGLNQQGYQVHGLGIKDHADAQLRGLCHTYQEVGIARLGAAISYFQRHGVRRATMAGKIHKLELLKPLYWLKHLPDLKCIATFYPHFISRSQDRKDDTILTAVVAAYAKEGIDFIPATDFVPELLVKLGTLTRRGLTHAQRKDVEFGWRIAKEIGRLDIGQSVAVKGQAIIAVEAVEGTDQCIRRAGQLCPAGKFAVVKVAKPQQDMRFDVPTVGVGTLRMMIDAGANVLAIEAHKTIIIDQPEVLQLADQHKLVIVSIADPATGQ
jgi:DUF1009 family protein